MTVMDTSAAPAPVLATRPRSVWIARPWVDLLVGCGGWSLPLLAISYALTGEAARQWSGAFYTLALISNYPHYMATVYRAYGRSDRGAHRLYTVWGTAALIALGGLAHVELVLLPLLFTAYIVWSPWHYTGQNYGLLVMFFKRAGLDVTPIERRRLRVAFVASYVMLLAAFNEGASTDPLVLSLGLHRDITRLVGGTAVLIFVVAGLAGFVSVMKRAPRSAVLAPALLYVTQGLWFVVPTTLAWTTGLAVPQTRYSSGILAVMHATQYCVDHAVLREARTGRVVGPGPLLDLGHRRRSRAVPPHPLACELWGARRLHREHADRHRGGEPAPLHDRRRGVEAARYASGQDTDG